MPAHPQFDEDAVLLKAMNAFWAHGFASTSMQDLVEHMGLNRGSIYATFGDKRSLFLRALRRYDRVHRETWFASLAARHGPSGAIVRAFESAVEAALAGGSQGCFLVNSALELAPHDPEIRELVADALRSVEDFFAEMLRAGDRDPGLAPALLSLFLGVRVLSRCRPERPLLRGIVAQVEAMVR